MNPEMLYIHVPFCHSKCAYCDFYSTPRPELIERFVGAVSAEAAERCPSGFAPSTIYIGGGTPSMLSPEQLGRMMDAMPRPAADLREFTVEANPEDVTPAWVEGLLAHTRADRVSMGVQSLDDAELSLIGRRHTAREAREAYRTLRSGGIENISLDLIYGLPGQSLDSWRRSLEGVLEMRPDHLSAYLLSYEPRTRLGVMLSKGLVEEASEETATRMYEILCSTAREAGYEHYEISNFALPGRRALHNSGYWDGTPYIGLGPGAHSFYDGQRGAVTPNLSAYLAAVGRGMFVPERESDSERYNDLIITSLRTARGLDPEQIFFEVGEKYADHFIKAARPLLSRGMLVINSEWRYAIPEDLWLVSDSIFLDLIIA